MNNEPKAFPGLGQDGLTMRDYFAAKVMPTMYSDFWADVHAGRTSQVPEDWMMCIAIDAYRLADAMMKEREK